jgi:CDGSH-type Zn-finger protein
MGIKMTNSPYEVDLEAEKKYFWCTCGLSKNQPFCDGAHKGSGLKSLHFDVPASQKVFLCGCKKTKNPPYCDGSHNG